MWRMRGKIHDPLLAHVSEKRVREEQRRIERERER